MVRLLLTDRRGSARPGDGRDCGAEVVATQERANRNHDLHQMKRRTLFAISVFPLLRFRLPHVGAFRTRALEVDPLGLGFGLGFGWLVHPVSPR
jgi:hypothetical protein